MASLTLQLRSSITLRLIRECYHSSFSAKTQCRALNGNISNLIYLSPACCFSTSPSSLVKRQIPFTYVREKKPESVFTSGDNEGLPKIDLLEPCLKYKDSEELKSASEEVKKILSVGHARHKETVKRQTWEMMQKFQKHEFDTGSTEVQVAALTVRIRNLQEHMRAFRKEKRGKVILKESIDARKKMLKKLRRQDYLRFEWLLKELNITYHPPPIFYHWTTRKGTLRVKTKQHCESIRKARIDAYKAKLKEEQAEFLKKKEETLKWIEKEEKELGTVPSEDTSKVIQATN